MIQGSTRECTDPIIPIRGYRAVKTALFVPPRCCTWRRRYFLSQPKPSSIGLNCHTDLYQFQTPALSLDKGHTSGEYGGRKIISVPLARMSAMASGDQC